MSEAQNPLALVVDDEEDVRQIARLALRVDGWRVEVAGNGKEGLAKAKDLSPSLILVDLMMPSMTGVEFCRKAIDELGMKDVPVLMISGVNEKAKVLDDFWDLPLRSRDFLKKPFDAAELIRRIHQLAPTAKHGASQNKGDRPAPAPAKGAPAASAGPPEPPAWLKLDRTPLPPKATQPEPPAAAKKSAAKEEHMRGYRILSIDDDEDIRTIIKLRLGMHHTVETAANGMLGLKAMETFQPDFIITDINMPVMNGLETAEAIRRHPRFFEVPIFFVTGETDANLPRKTFEIGGNLYLRKPLDPERLIKCLDHFLRETGLQPNRYFDSKAGSPAKAAKTVQSGKPRILVVDFNIENHRLLRTILGAEGTPGRLPGGPFEIFWTEDARTALGNLSRWEPDAIFYNPRNPNLDAVGFGQMLKLNHELEKTRVWLVGTRFYEADTNYSRHTLKHETISLEGSEAEIERQIGAAVAEASSAIREKACLWADLHSEEIERLRQMQQSDSRKARERDMLRKRYKSVQEFIDRTLA